MGSRPKLQRLITTLEELAVEELGDSAKPVDFVVRRVGLGQTVTALAQEVAKAMGEPASRSWLSWRFNHLTPRAKERIADARLDAARKLEQPPLRSNDQPAQSGEINLADDGARLTESHTRGPGENDNTRRLRGSVPASK